MHNPLTPILSLQGREFIIISSTLGRRAGRHPARIYSRWDMGNGIGVR
jgi:hypothetical protein